jgi:class 3 adenylate cyclase
MTALPNGTVTFLFSDVDGSTRLVKELQDEYESVLATHRDLLRRVFRANRGLEVDTQGDSFFVVFARARDGVMAAAEAQRQMEAHGWPHQSSVRVRMGLHTGEPHLGQHGYTGVAVHRAARLCSLAHGGQVLLSRSTAGILDDDDLPSVSLRDLGEHGLKDFERPERIYQLIADGLSSEFPPLRSIDRQRPLTGTVTLVMCEGRRVMRLAKEMPPEHFGELLGTYHGLLRDLLEEMGGREVETVFDTAMAAFPTAKRAALAATAAQRAVDTYEWPHGVKLSMSVGLHSGEAGVGWVGPAVNRCMEFCDTAEGGQIVMSEATARLLDDEDLGGLTVRDLGNQRARRMESAPHLYELA